MRLIFFTFLVFLSACLAASHDASAQYRVSSDEDVAIAFFKTANAPPNFEKLATASKAYRMTPVARQNDFAAKEKIRLQNAYNNFDVRNNLLTLQTRVDVELHHEMVDEKTEKFTMTLSFGKDDALFFPYKFGDYNIAIVPRKMDSSFEQNLTRQQYALIQESLGGKDGYAKLFIQIKPQKSYIDEPVKMGGLDQWAMVADVAGLVMMDKNGTRLWTYGADWYISPVTEELRDMYDTQALEKKQEMEDENPLRPAP